jgi:hypothetical protein
LVPFSTQPPKPSASALWPSTRSSWMQATPSTLMWAWARSPSASTSCQRRNKAAAAKAAAVEKAAAEKAAAAKAAAVEKATAEKAAAKRAAAKAAAAMAVKRWHFFLSHTQRNGDAKSIALELFFGFQEQGKKSWLDVKNPKMDMEDASPSTALQVRARTILSLTLSLPLALALAQALALALS